MSNFEVRTSSLRSGDSIRAADAVLPVSPTHNSSGFANGAYGRVGYANGPRILSGSIADSSTLSDSISRGVGTFRSLSDNELLTGGITRSLALFRSVLDNEILSDSVLKSLVASRSIADNEVSSDVVSRILAQSRSLADNELLAD